MRHGANPNERVGANTVVHSRSISMFLQPTARGLRLQKQLATATGEPILQRAVRATGLGGITVGSTAARLRLNVTQFMDQGIAARVDERLDRATLHGSLAKQLSDVKTQEAVAMVQIGVRRNGQDWMAFLRRSGVEEEIGTYGSAKFAASAAIHVRQLLLKYKVEPTLPLKYP